MMNSKGRFISFDINIKQQEKKNDFDIFGDFETKTKPSKGKIEDDFLDLI